jgi:hypothetical protein
MGDLDIVGALSIDDMGSDIIQNFTGLLGGMEGAAGSALVPILALVDGIAAFVGGLGDAVSNAMGFEDVLTRLNVITGNIGATTEIVTGANADAIAKMSELTDSYNQRMSDLSTATAEKVAAMTQQIETSNTDFLSKMADKASAFNDQLNNMEASHADRIASLNEAMDTVKSDFADAQEQRQQNLADKLAGIETTSNTKRTSILEKMAATHSSAEYARLQIELEALDKTTTAQEDAAKLQESKAEAAAKKQEDRRLQAIERQIEKENKAFDKATVAAQVRYDKEVKIADEAHTKQLASYTAMQTKMQEAETKQLDKTTAAYEKQAAKIKATWGDVALGFSPAVTQTIEHMSGKSLVDLATSISKVTTYSKEQIIQAEMMASTFETIGKDTMPALMQAGEDFAAKTGMELTPAVDMLGRVLEDPIKNMGLLRRAQIYLTAEQITSIKTMQKHNDIAGAQAVVLAAVEAKVGGLAAAMGDTTSGKLERLHNQLVDLTEPLVTAFLPTLQSATDWLIKTFGNDATTKNVQDLGHDIQAVGVELQKAFTEHKPQIDEFIKQVGTVATSFQKAFVEYGPKIQAFVTQLTGWLGSAQQGFAATSATTNSLAERFSDMTGSIQAGLARLAQATETWLAAIQAFWKDHGEQIVAVVTWAWDFISAIWQQGADFLGGVANMLLDVLTGNWDQLGVDLKNTTDTLWTDMQRIWSLGGDLILHALGDLLGNIGGWFAGLKDDALRWGGDVIDGFIRGIQDKAGELQSMLDDFIKTNITDRFNFHLQLGSPSELMAGMGRDIARGLQMGMGQGAAGVAGASASMASTVIGGASSIVNSNNMSLTVNQAQGGEASLSMNYMLIRSLAGI